MTAGSGGASGPVPGHAAQVARQQVVGQLALGQRKAETHHVVDFAERAHEEVGGRRRRVVVRSRRRRPCRTAAVLEVDRHRAGRVARLHVEVVVADHEQAVGRHAHELRRVQHAVGRRLVGQVVVARHDHVEVGRAQPDAELREAGEDGVDGRAAAARDNTEAQAEPAQAAHELLGARVGLGLRRAHKLEPFEGGERGRALAALRQRQDVLEHVDVVGAPDLAPDEGEVERLGARERAVEVEQHALEAEGSRKDLHCHRISNRTRCVATEGARVWPPAHARSRVPRVAVERSVKTAAA